MEKNLSTQETWFVDLPAKNNKQVLSPIKITKHILTRRERELESEALLLRKKQPYLSIHETTAYRYSFKHNLCLDLLQEGYHKSFREVFNLLQRQAKDREEAGPDSLLWLQPQLQHEDFKLERLKHDLSKAELAERRGNKVGQYAALFALASYFLSIDDKWLAEHFFSSCLEISCSDSHENFGQMQAEGHINVGMRRQELGKNLEAAYHYEEAYNLTKDNIDWLNRHGTKLHTDTCTELCSIYTAIAETLTGKDNEEATSYFHKAFAMAKESTDRKLIAESGYRLGMSYINIPDNEMALKYLRGYLDQSHRQNDVIGTGKACDAIAKLYQQDGKIEKCIEYLSIYANMAEHCQHEIAYSKACRNLGSIYNIMGKYDEASENFGKSYNLSRSANDQSSINVNRVLFGVSMAHNMLGRAVDYMTSDSAEKVAVVSEWKSARADEFIQPEDNTRTVHTKTPPETNVGKPQTIYEEDSCRESPTQPSDSHPESPAPLPDNNSETPT